MAKIALYPFLVREFNHLSFFILYTKQSDVKFANVSGKYAIMKNSSLCQRAEQFVLEEDELGMQGCFESFLHTYDTYSVPTNFEVLVSLVKG